MKKDIKDTNGQKLALVLLSPLLMWWFSFALHTNWEWFAVPAGLPAIGMAHVFGLFLIFRMFRGAVANFKSATETIKDEISTPLFFLGLGWIVHKIMAG